MAVVATTAAGCSSDHAPRASAGRSSSPASSPASSSQTPTPGAAGAGDAYFPDLGNGGYDVVHYDLAISVPDPHQNQMSATATITAKASQALSRFDLDLSGLTVGSVTVDGNAATSVAREGRELVVTPAKPIDDNTTFTTVVAYSGAPEPRSTPSIPIAVGWIATGDGSFVVSEPEGAST